MFNISEKYSGKDKKEAIRKFKLKDQEYRKKIHPVTRELYRYFNQKFHISNWNPNGLYQRNKYYYFIGPSLGFIDKEGNKRYDKTELNRERAKSNQKKIKVFPEFNFMEDNQYKIIIEYCSNCEEHQAYTFHKEEIFKNYATYLEKCILLRFPFIKVILKPIDSDNIRLKFPKVNKSGEMVNKLDIRIGAFEVILSCKKKGEQLKNELLYSKLEKKMFPSISNILDKIVKYVPSFNGEIIVYEKETRIDSQEAEKDDSETKDIMEGLEINIYLINNQQIINLISKAYNEIQNQYDPKKRLMKFREQYLINKISMGGEYTSETNISNNKKYLTKSSSMTNIMSNNILEDNNLFRAKSSYRLKRQKTNKSDNFKLYNRYDIDELYKSSTTSNKYIFDKEISNNLKGRLMIRKYTDKDGIIKIGPLPYDSYYVEVKESIQFRNVGLCLSFNDLNYYKDNYIKKYIGLYTQENAFIQVHAFEMKENSKETIPDITLLSNVKIILKKIKEKEDKNNLDTNIEIKESNKQGIYENTVLPGKYILEAKKDNYEISTKFIELKKGKNLINVEMCIERYYNLHIEVLNFENLKEPIKNAEITIYKNSNEIIEECITNKKGEYNYIVDKELDFLTIVIEKMEYFPTQRVFKRKPDTKKNSKGEYEEKMTFLLIKKNYVINNQLMIIITYSNLYEDNFDTKNIQISNKIKSNIDISYNDKQKSDGIICTIIKNKNNEKNDALLNENISMEESREQDNYDNIISISYKIISEQLLIYNNEYDLISMNGLEKYGCQSIIYTPKNIFYIPSPSYSSKNYSIWFLGWLDIKNELFFQINTLINTQNDRTLFLGEWFEFLQTLINEQIYSTLFEFFGFEKGNLEIGDRLLDIESFEQRIKSLKYFNRKEKLITNFICAAFKSKNNMISFSLFKQIVFSNLKNFMDDI